MLLRIDPGYVFSMNISYLWKLSSNWHVLHDCYEFVGYIYVMLHNDAINRGYFEFSCAG